MIDIITLTDFSNQNLPKELLDNPLLRENIKLIETKESVYPYHSEPISKLEVPIINFEEDPDASNKWKTYLAEKSERDFIAKAWQVEENKHQELPRKLISEAYDSLGSDDDWQTCYEKITAANMEINYKFPNSMSLPSIGSKQLRKIKLSIELLIQLTMAMNDGRITAIKILGIGDPHIESVVRKGHASNVEQEIRDKLFDGFTYTKDLTEYGHEGVVIEYTTPIDSSAQFEAAHHSTRTDEDGNIINTNAAFLSFGRESYWRERTELRLNPPPEEVI